MLQMLKIILLVFCGKKTIDSVIKFIDYVIHETHWWHSHFALWTNISGLELFIRFPETKFGIVPCKLEPGCEISRGEHGDCGCELEPASSRPQTYFRRNE